MVLNFEENGYVDVDRISALRWFPEAEKGVVVIGPEKIAVDKEKFEIIEKAYVWLHKGHIYDKNLKKGDG